MADLGAPADAGTGSREPDPQAVPALSGFDPARGDKPRRRIEIKLEISADDWPSVRRVLRRMEEDIVVHGAMRNLISGGWDSGYSVCCTDDASITHDIWADRLDAYLRHLDARDSDGSGEAGQTAKQAEPKATARAEGIAETSPEQS